MCNSPIQIKAIDLTTNRPYTVQCGKCVQCKQRRINEWAFRLQQESTTKQYHYFITLTYAPANITKTENGLSTLVKQDLQKFFKRLRHHSKTDLKYYANGEYGTIKKRPHYHIILFSDKEIKNEILLSWTLGHIDFRECNIKTIRYTLKYLAKPNRKKFQKDDRLNEFSLKSTGLGKVYLTEQNKRYHLSNIHTNNNVFIEKYRITLPRYYQKKIYSDSDRKKIAQKVELIEKKKLDLRMQKLKKQFKDDSSLYKYLASQKHDEQVKYYSHNKNKKI